jgi:outer membrane protein
MGAPLAVIERTKRGGLVLIKRWCVSSKVRRSTRWLGRALLCVSVAVCAAQANSPGSSEAPLGSVTLAEVIDSALRSYPQIHVSQEELNASIANIQLARTAYLPHADVLFQANRATRNNVFGALLPQSTIPPISGPVIGSNNGGSVWGSAAGVLVSWQPFDFGLRHANVEAARDARSRADAALEVSQLDVATAAGNSFLTYVAAKETVRAATAAVENWTTLLKTIHALAAAQLRPGADESRIEAELAMARTQLVYAKQAEAESIATLSKFLDHPSPSLSVQSERLLSQLPVVDQEQAFDVATHPVMREQNAAVSESAAQLHALDRTWVPQFTIEGAASARGTGAETDGTRLAGANGLAPNFQNYAAGINVTFPLFDFVTVHSRERAAGAILGAERSRQQLLDKELKEQFDRARAAFEAARQVADNTPIEVKAAHSAFDQARARYEAGLSPIDDLAQAQRLVVQAEVDDSIARLNVWRTLLQFDAARGDIQPFLQAVHK